LERTARTVLNQTNPNWEWVLHDDSDNSPDAARLEKFFAQLNDKRIRYFRFNKQSGGLVGMSKKRAANLCTGDYMAELDHDDLLMPDITDKILKHGEGFDFIYSNCSSVIVNDDESFAQGEHFGGDGFAMGYGKYRKTVAVNPLTGLLHEYQETVTFPVNPKSIRNIVGVCNHIRVWNRNFYESVGGHNVDIGVADDYELIVRSFLAGGKFLHLDSLGYLQVEDADRTTYNRNYEIQHLWNAVLATYDEQIKAEFELRNIKDWAFRWALENLGFRGEFDIDGLFRYCNYYKAPTYLDAETANCTV
jgi:glycosyltransferase involved in cell wall biosynthesis